MGDRVRQFHLDAEHVPVRSIAARAPVVVRGSGVSGDVGVRGKNARRASLGWATEDWDFEGFCAVVIVVRTRTDPYL